MRSPVPVSAVAVAAVVALVAAGAVLLFAGATLWIVTQWTLLRLMTVVVAAVGLLFLGCAAAVAAAGLVTRSAPQAAQPADVDDEKDMEHAAEAAVQAADGIGNAFASAGSAGRLAIGGSLHLWAAGTLAAVDVTL